MLLSGGMAQAQTDKCQAAIEKEVEKLHKDALQRIHKCLDFAQKEKVKRQKRIDDGNADKPNWDWTKAAFLCEIQLRGHRERRGRLHWEVRREDRRSAGQQVHAR
jgi:hypothetical protein